MEQQDILNKKIGSRELPKLEAKEIEVQGLRVDEKSKGDKKIGDILVLICKHPDKNDLIEFTKIKVLREDKAKVIGLWVSTDADGNIQKGSVLDTLLDIVKVETPSDLVGKKLPTIRQSDDSPYLCIKGY